MSALKMKEVIYTVSQKVVHQTHDDNFVNY